MALTVTQNTAVMTATGDRFPAAAQTIKPSYTVKKFSVTPCRSGRYYRLSDSDGTQVAIIDGLGSTDPGAVVDVCMSGYNISSGYLTLTTDDTDAFAATLHLEDGQ